MKKTLLIIPFALITVVLNAGNSKEFKKAFDTCNSGNATGCYNLGIMYVQGKEIRQNYFKAKEHFGKACDGGVANGCYNLGIMYGKGKGVRQNYSKGKEYFGKTCDLGLQVGCHLYKEINELGF